MLDSDFIGGFALQPVKTASAANPRAIAETRISPHHMEHERHAPMPRSAKHRAVPQKIAVFPGCKLHLARLLLRGFHFETEFTNPDSVGYVRAFQHQNHRLTFLQRDLTGLKVEPLGGYLNASWLACGCTSLVGCRNGDNCEKKGNWNEGFL